MTGDKLHVFEDSAGEFRWHRKARNGEIIGQGESHSREADAWRAGYRANPDLAPRSGMEHAIEQAAAVLNVEGAHCGECGREPGDPLSECPDCERFVIGYARALAAAGLLAPAPLREEWRAFSPARGMESPEPTLSAALDEVEGQLDLTDMDPGAFGTERDWRVERRLASPWLPVDRGEGDGRADR